LNNPKRDVVHILSRPSLRRMTSCITRKAVWLVSSRGFGGFFFGMA